MFSSSSCSASSNDNVSAVHGGERKEEKRRRYKQKQERKLALDCITSERNTWMDNHRDFVTQIRPQDVLLIRQQLEITTVKNEDHDDCWKNTKRKMHTYNRDETSSRLQEITKLLQPYLNLKDTKEDNKTARDKSKERLFIAEGTETVRLLIQQVSCTVTTDNDDGIRMVSMLVKPSVFFDKPVKLLSEVENSFSALPPSNSMESKNVDAFLSSPPFHIMIASEATLSTIAGFLTVRGAIACGVVPRNHNEAWLDRFLLQTNNKIRMLALDGISDTSNLGSIIRTSAAFGISVIVLSHDCCDAWYRRCIRVSMGHIFAIPIVRVGSLANVLSKHSDTIESYAAVANNDKQATTMVLEGMPRNSVLSKSWCCVFGNEGHGISDAVLNACTNRIQIGMVQGVDSLSVSVATGILLHGLCERECKNV